MREMIVAARVEQLLSKAEILELYLNSVFLGRGSWGIELAARGYFGKPASELTLPRARCWRRSPRGRITSIPTAIRSGCASASSTCSQRMREDGVIDAEEAKRGVTVGVPTLVAFERPRRDFGFHFTDQVAARGAHASPASRGSPPRPTRSARPSTRSCSGPPRVALQEGLARYEAATGRVQFQAAEANLGDAIRRIESQGQANADKPAWQQALDQCAAAALRRALAARRW